MASVVFFWIIRNFVVKWSEEDFPSYVQSSIPDLLHNPLLHLFPCPFYRSAYSLQLHFPEKDWDFSMKLPGCTTLQGQANSGPTNGFTDSMSWYLCIRAGVSTETLAVRRDETSKTGCILVSGRQNLTTHSHGHHGTCWRKRGRGRAAGECWVRGKSTHIAESSGSRQLN